MTDRLPGAPGRYSAVVAGEELQKMQTGEPFAITLTRDDQPIKAGTPYSKAAVLPDDVASMLCPESEDPTPADAFRSILGVTAGVGRSKDAFAVQDRVYIHMEDIYCTAEGRAKSLAGCNLYRLEVYEDINSDLLGKTIRIRTYAYGDMAAGKIDGEYFLVNPDANITENPESGVCEFEITIPDEVDGAGHNYNFSFCENNGYTELEVYVKKGTVWEEIKKLQSVEGYSTFESALTAIRYIEQSLTEEQKAQARKNIGFGTAVDALLDAEREKLKAADGSAAIVCDPTGSNIMLSDASDRLLKGLKLYGKTTQDGIPTPDAPVELVSVGDGGMINVMIPQNNLFGGRLFADKITELTGRTVNLDAGTISYSGPQIGSKIVFDEFEPNTQYTFFLSGYQANGYVQMKIKYTDGTIVPSGVGLKFDDETETLCLFTSAEGKTIESLIGSNQVASSTSLNYDKCGIFKGVLTESDFEAYTAQILTVSVPDGLPGIAVESGGNYTDENGQQWICDELNFVQGVHVQRIGLIKSYAGEDISEPYMSTTGDLSEGATVQYVLTNPVETPIAKDELAAYATLHTNKPNTYIRNDGGAGMAVMYVADTKTYIDNKFTELQNAILSIGANV